MSAAKRLLSKVAADELLNAWENPSLYAESTRKERKKARKAARRSRQDALRSLPARLVPIPTSQPRVRYPADAPRIRLHVPFEWKDHAKALGARWDADLKTWWSYSLAGMDADYLLLWLLDGEIEMLPPLPAPKRGSLKAKAKPGCGVIAEFNRDQQKPVTDSLVEHDSDSLPWEDCENVPGDWMNRRIGYLAAFGVTA